MILELTRFSPGYPQVEPEGVSVSTHHIISMESRHHTNEEGNRIEYTNVEMTGRISYTVRETREWIANLVNTMR